MASFSIQDSSTPTFPDATSYPPDFDSLLFCLSPTPKELPLNQRPFERLYRRTEQNLDVTSGNSRTSGTTFILSSSPTSLHSSPRVSNQTKQDEANFDTFLQKKKPHFILTAQLRMTYCHHLENPTIVPHSKGSDCQADQNVKHTTLAEYKLQDGQVYRQAEWDDSTRKQEPPKYVLMYTDAF